MYRNTDPAESVETFRIKSDSNSIFEENHLFTSHIMAPLDKTQVRQAQLDVWASNVDILRKEGAFTDVVILCGNKDIHAHRIVLSASSPYFRAMLQTAMTEASTGQIQLKALDPDAVEVVVKFLYTGCIMPIEDDAALLRAVLEAAHMLQVAALFEYSLQVLKSKLSIHYFADLLEIAELYDVPEVQDKAHILIAYQFEEACQSNDFKQLSLNQLRKILAHPVLSATALDIIVEGILIWAEWDIQARLPNLASVFDTLDLTQLSASFIKKLLNSENAIKKDDYILSLMTKASAQYDGWASFQSTHLITTSNLICYGKSSSHESLFSTFDCKTNCFGAPVPLSASLPEDTTAVAYNGKIYFIGGVNETGMSKTVLRFYPIIKTIVNFSNLLHEVSDSGAIAFLGKIYVIGGFDLYKRHSRTVQCFDPISGICTEIAPTSKLHRYPLVGQIAEHIYVVGTKLNDQHIERYSPLSNQWTVVSTVPNPVCGCGGAFGKRLMYCVPDCNKPSETWACNPAALVWKKNALKNSPVSFQGRWTVSMYSIDEFVLFVTDEQENIFAYIPGNDMWIQLPFTKLETSRNGPPSMMCVMGFCVVG